MREDWESKRLKEIGDIVSGGTPDTTIQKNWDGSIVWITPADLSKLSGRNIDDSKRKISDFGLSSSSAILIPKNNIVVSSRAPIGYIAVCKVDFATNQGCKSIRLYEDQDADFQYYNLLFNVDEIKRFGEGTTFAEISKKYFENVIINVPKSLKTQQRIARILGTLDSVIARTEAVIAKYTALKAGLLQDLFTRGIDASGNLRPSPQEAPELYKQSALGLIPKDWIEDTIDGITEKILGGGTPPRNIDVYWNGKIPWASVKDFSDDSLFIEYTEEFISEEGLRNSASNLIPPQIPIVCFRMAVGRTAMADVPVSINQDLKAIFPKREKINSRYLLYLLHSLKAQFDGLGVGSTVKGITLDVFVKTLIAYPSSTVVQEKAAQMMQESEISIQTEQAYLAKLQGIRAGLMADLLSGRVEVSGYGDGPAVTGGPAPAAQVLPEAVAA